MRQRRALRQFTLSTGKSAGRNSLGRITVFHRGGGLKRLEALDCLIAACDAGRGSSFGPLDLSPAKEPEPCLPKPKVVPIPRVILVPELEKPLLTDIQRRAELQQRLVFYFIGKNERRHLPLFLGILEKQVLLEKRVEAALVRDGFPAHIVLGWRSQIRGLLFNHPIRRRALSENTLNRYLGQVKREGTRQS
ncbi:hypothetical protein RND71_039937 [Anisodus tanguticus]|uniref:Uncharacterized protein n=1 Tax=Anisodus tanguticus TaxID=243964 RepID=A0AAE1QXS3_9SOLA|nr:hypothetical protein RND71_039937 [Anisodus tanguticus]